MREIIDNITISESGIKDGDYFLALMDDNCYLKGIITLTQNKHTFSVYLCQNNKDGSITSDKKGFDYSWICSDNNKLRLEDNKIEVLYIITEEEYNKPENSVTSKRRGNVGDVFGHSVRAKNLFYSFGCGEVTFTREVIKQFLQGMQIYTPKCLEINAKNDEILKSLLKEKEELENKLSEIQNKIESINLFDLLKEERKQIGTEYAGFAQVDREMNSRGYDACSLTEEKLTDLFTEEMEQIKLQEV